MASGEDRTEKATPKRRAEARKRGQVARSREWPVGFTYIALFGTLAVSGGWAATQMAHSMSTALSEAGRTGAIGPAQGWEVLMGAGAAIVRIAAPFAIVGTVAAFLANVLQVKPGFTPEVIKPRFSVLNPINGVKTLFSVRSLVYLVRDLIKVAVIGGIAFTVLWTSIPVFLDLMGAGPAKAMATVANLVMRMGWAIIAVYLLIMVLDLLFERWLHEKNMRMTKQEVKREAKEADLPPEVRTQLRRRQREMANRRMMAAVPNADVVITNPTHYAVALRYARSLPAPEVVAKGADKLALRIIETARANDVMVMQNPPLARSLYATAQVGQLIPAEAFGAVAEILAHVYRVTRREPALT